jgi:nucleoid-associated protein YgaU
MPVSDNNETVKTTSKAVSPKQEKPVEEKADIPKPEQPKEEPVEKESATPPPVPPPAPPPPPPPTETKKEEEDEPRRRRFLWMIPVAIIIIAILAVIFYFRACNDKEPEKEPTEQIITTPSDEPEPLPLDTVPAEPEVKEPEVKEPEPKISVAERTEDGLYVLKPGNYLYQLAGQFYGDSLFWVIIYKANAKDIADPEAVKEGQKLLVPRLEGDRYNLTRNDSMNISEGYRLLYEFYMIEEDPRTSNFYFGMLRYRPK